MGNLFQLSCADVVERFQLSVFLIIVTIRNCIEVLGSGAAGDISNAILVSGFISNCWHSITA
jgi:Eukaryotic membrane protein family